MLPWFFQSEILLPRGLPRYPCSRHPLLVGSEASNLKKKRSRGISARIRRWSSWLFHRFSPQRKKKGEKEKTCGRKVNNSIDCLADKCSSQTLWFIKPCRLYKNPLSSQGWERNVFKDFDLPRTAGFFPQGLNRAAKQVRCDGGHPH